VDPLQIIGDLVPQVITGMALLFAAEPRNFTPTIAHVLNDYVVNSLSKRLTLNPNNSMIAVVRNAALNMDYCRRNSSLRRRKYPLKNYKTIPRAIMLQCGTDQGSPKPLLQEGGFKTYKINTPFSPGTGG